MSDFQDSKNFAKSKHFHSLHKDKNKYKKKAKFKALQKQKQNSTQSNEKTKDGINTPNKLQNEGDDIEEDENDDNQVENIKPRSKFSRRKLESNDYRFSKEATEEEELKHETAMNIYNLLDSSENTGSHFRFQNEKEWDDDESLSSKVLDIDCDAISQSLKLNLTIAQQLLLEDNHLFTEDLTTLEKIPKTSSTNVTPSNSFLMSNSNSESTSKNQSKSKQTKNETIENNSNIAQQKANPQPISTSTKPLLDQTKDDDTKLLDNLLNSSSNTNTVSNQNKEKVQEQTNPNENDLESWLDTVI